MTKDGVIWENTITKGKLSMVESDIIPIVNATARLYQTVLESQKNALENNIK